MRLLGSRRVRRSAEKEKGKGKRKGKRKGLEAVMFRSASAE
jgi:hypothetical protein